jgi:hypothetical protein
MAGFYRVLFALILMVAMEHSLQAAERPNFSGFWTLDLKAPESTSMDALLEAQGFSMIMRKVMDTMSMTQDITQTGKTLTINFTTTYFGEQTLVLIVDGETHILDIDKLGNTEFRSFWDKNGISLVTIMKFADQGNQKPEWTSWRYLKDEGRTLIVDHLLTLDDGRKLTGKRVFRRK